MKEFPRFIQAFARFSVRDTGANQYFLDTAEKRIYSKKEMLFTEGHVNHRVWHIESGLIRHFETISEKEITTLILDQDEFVFAPDSFFDQVPSKENIQALEETVTYSISLKELQEAKRLYPDLGEFDRAIDRKYRVSIDNFRKMLTALDNKEKYDWLLKNHSSWINRVPLEYLSSFLGMSKDTLSTIKASFKR